METTESTDKILAPVLISVYDRRKHLEACIEALKKNPEAKDTPLYIVSDGWQHESHRKAIEEVREYINTITGFKEVHTRFRETNRGMNESSLEAFEWVLSEHDRLIRMEDDIICSPSYLQYLNNGLVYFENNPSIFSICAHTHPNFKNPSNYPLDIFLWQSFSPWGYAIWKNRWIQYRTCIDTNPQQLENSIVWKKFARIRPRMDSRKVYLQNRVQNDGRINLHIFLNNLYSVFPNKNLSINGGLDGSGTNCARGWTYPEQQLSHPPITVSPEVQPCKKIERQLYRIHYSILNHGIGSILRKMGIFDHLYALYKNRFIKKPS